MTFVDMQVYLNLALTRLLETKRIYLNSTFHIGSHDCLWFMIDPRKHSVRLAGATKKLTGNQWIWKDNNMYERIGNHTYFDSVCFFRSISWNLSRSIPKESLTASSLVPAMSPKPGQNIPRTSQTSPPNLPNMCQAFAKHLPNMSQTWPTIHSAVHTWQHLRT